MSDNLIFLFNKLSYQIVIRAFSNEKAYNNKVKDESYFKKCVRKVTQRGCDVLLGKLIVPPLPDPCVTDYGGNWSPLALLLDYAKDYESKGAIKCHDVLKNSIQCLIDEECDCTNDVLKFLLLLKGPMFDGSMQSEMLSTCGSSLLINSMESLINGLDEQTPQSSENSLTRSSSIKRALKYEESWTKNFDLKFEVLGEYSKKNILVPEKVSFDSLFSAKTPVTSESQSNSFVFTDFYIEKNFQSEKSIFDLNRSTCMSDIPLLDSFVDNPISHKLPIITKGKSKSSYLVRSKDQMKRRLHLLKEEDQSPGGFGPPVVDLKTDHSDEGRLESESGFELKRNSNCSHSFAILYEKSDNKSISSTDNLLLVKDKMQCKTQRSYSKHSQSSSKEIVLGLWEHDKSILKEFRPELATTIPTLRMITIVDFVEDVKYLLTGINSGTFKYNTEESSFHIEFGTCLNDVTPESLFHFSKEFIETGNYYMKLSIAATECGKTKHATCTTITQAFWKSIFDYLELHYSTVLAIPPTTNLMMLKSTVRDIHEMIRTMSYVCKVVKDDPLPEGGQLLTYLLDVVEKINLPNVKSVVFGVVQNCCSVYFKCILQPWLFKGQLEKDNNEFFVECTAQKVNTKSRSYYTSFYIVPEKVPSFLLGFEEGIFNCGKSVHFLKLFNSGDTFCQILEKLEYPEMRLCFSDCEIEALEKKFKDYCKIVMDACGGSISILNLRNEEKEREKRYIEYIHKCKWKQEEERRLTKLRELDELKAQKELQNKLLNEEIKRMEEERKKKEEEKEKALREMEEKIKEAAENERAMINQEKNLLVNYYNELQKELDTQLNVCEKRRKRLQEVMSNLWMLESKDDRFLDIINDNTINDGMAVSGDETTQGNPGEQIKSMDLNSNPLVTEASESPGSKSTVSVVTVETLKGSQYSEANTVSVDENSNFSSLSASTGEEIVSTNATVDEEEKMEKKKEEVNGNDKKKVFDTWKSLSHRTVAATEAMRNKMKVLKSEFQIGSDNSELFLENTEKDAALGLTLTASCKKMKDSDYNILKCSSDSILVKPVISKTNIGAGSDRSQAIGQPNAKDESNNNLKLGESVCLKDALNFRQVGLERKRVCLNLENPLERKESDDMDSRLSTSDSVSSFLTPPTCECSEENIGDLTKSDKKLGTERRGSLEAKTEPETEYNSDIDVIQASSTSGTLLLNPRYRNALVRDTEISNHKLSYDDVFQNMNEIEFDNLPCRDLMKFQRLLRKSAQIPLIVQEKLANDALLKHLLIRENILSHLKSLRGFFFLNDGEFGRSFTHNIFRSLAKCKESHEFFEKSNLSNIVNEALNYTIHGSDTNSQNLSFKIVKMPPFLNHSSHDVLSPFELTYKVEWPLNLILTEKALAKYRRVFKFLLKLKRINWTLNENCLHLNSIFKSPKSNRHVMAGSPHYHKIQIYRHAMTQVMITLDEYIFSNGIQLPWINFLQDLETASNIDHLYQKHVRYVKDVLLRCFLTNNSKDLLGCIHDVIELALKFHYTTVSSPLVVVDGAYEHPKFQVLKTTFNEFCAVVKSFLRTLKDKIANNQIIKSHYILIEKFDIKLT